MTNLRPLLLILLLLAFWAGQVAAGSSVGHRHAVSEPAVHSHGEHHHDHQDHGQQTGSPADLCCEADCGCPFSCGQSAVMASSLVDLARTSSAISAPVSQAAVSLAFSRFRPPTSA